jgi:Zn-dependent peptidase ImmA (M78 family)
MPKHKYSTKDYRVKEDIEATDFACELLMPENEFKLIVNNRKLTYEKIHELMNIFQVTSRAVMYRAWMLGIIKQFD